MLEFYADPNLPYYKSVFNPEKGIILHCASVGRSALAVQSLKSMGYENVAHLEGGIKAWKDAGLILHKITEVVNAVKAHARGVRQRWGGL